MQFNVQVVFITTASLLSPLWRCQPQSPSSPGRTALALLLGISQNRFKNVSFRRQLDRVSQPFRCPNTIELFISGGGNEFCTNGPALLLNGPSGCATAPAG
ncbi:hypothetical protein CPB84DRAFT_1791019 [Gymnopilus junonius]|uniref:Secreted protein n=1 Tax=Gymnopilus junonius TaxID=109634 RepID=A0A9P5TJ34_GYMJU|nr:hypothetical protein CPB84DRAFT_1791019 [Gymnopilus junonius]